MITTYRQLRECTSGAALLEATLVIPVLLLLMAGTIDFGRAIQDYHTADKSMRNATRYLARVPEAAVCNWGWDNAKDLAIYGTADPPSGARPLLPGWSPETLSLERDPGCAAAPDPEMTVAISASVPIATPIISGFGFPSVITIRIRHEERHIGE